MNTFVLPLSGVMFGRIDWPVDGGLMAFILLAVFAVLVIALAREMRASTATSGIVTTPTRRLPRRIPQQQQAI
jgi:hypothetical protein